MFTRRRLLQGVGGLALAAGLVQTVKASGKIHEIHMVIEPVEGRELPEFYFEPVGLWLRPGDSVRWIAASPHHTVTAYHRQHAKVHRVPEGVGPFSSPVVPVGQSWEYTFEIPGVYDYWCAPHEVYGMAGRLVVDYPVRGPAREPVTDFGPLGAYGNAGKVLNDPNLDAFRIFVRDRVFWSEIDQANKQPPTG